MADSEIKEIIKRLDEIQLMRVDIINMRSDLERMELSLKKMQSHYEDQILPNIKTWNATSDNQNKMVWIVVGAVVVGLLGVIGLG